MKNVYLAQSLLTALFLFLAPEVKAQNNVIDEVVWIVGDEAIYKSEVEEARQDAQVRGVRWEGDPYCIIPEQIAVTKLFLNQAELDSIYVTDSQVNNSVEMYMQELVANFGSVEKLEELYGMSESRIRAKIFEQRHNEMIAQEVRKKIVGNVKVTPAEVRRYVRDMPADEIPYIPTQVEVQIITIEPVIPQEEIDEVKADLRNYTERINSGEIQFSTLARLYSEDLATARNGGETGFFGRGEMVPEFSAVSFNLSDPQKVSKIVETEYGYHIIQLIEKLGDRVNVRHILRTPKVSDESLMESLARLDTIADNIRSGKNSFEYYVETVSADKDTRSNKGLMTFQPEDSYTKKSRYQLQELPQDVAKVISDMHIGEVSEPFVMQKGNKDVCAIVKLKTKVNGHKATVDEDFQILSSMVLQEKSAKVLEKWIREKQRTTYVKINEGWNGTDFQYPGWGQN